MVQEVSDGVAIGERFLYFVARHANAARKKMQRYFGRNDKLLVSVSSTAGMAALPAIRFFREGEGVEGVVDGDHEVLAAVEHIGHG